MSIEQTNDLAIESHFRRDDVVCTSRRRDNQENGDSVKRPHKEWICLPESCTATAGSIRHFVNSWQYDQSRIVLRRRLWLPANQISSDASWRPALLALRR